MRESISKKTKEVIEKELREMDYIQSLAELTRIGARACPELDSGMMLQVGQYNNLFA